MKEIILIRHGKPASAHNERVNATGFAKWVRQYDKAELDVDSHPHFTVDLTNHYIIASNLKRARLSAEKYSNNQISEVNCLFREMDIPRYKLPFTLRAWNWVYLNRALWMAGKKGPFESFQQAKVRARLASEYLCDLAQQQQRIALFGHAMTNRVLRHNLRQQGWSLVQKQEQFWGVSKLTRP
ncbi:histidine phosphatase family protein [Alteromonas sp. ASW11-130]|uniref:histidine phosphatase family protein n=1 Tax=Alteromonas sp. ASW11-130 TaxID=3015775 RepID=UPI00224277D8|nr:histidine phosphatase family protein [Alteromonas sp. ASW11-130]MCW8091043.1 histidine phosphatase family protein [Alteromonas sp. ASW11-130]